MVGDGASDPRVPGDGSIIAGADSRRTDWFVPIVAVALLFLLVVGALWSVVDRDLREREVSAERVEIERLRDKELEAVRHWADDLLADARLWASDPLVVASVVRLLDTDIDDLRASPAQAAIRDRMRGFLELNSLEGYFAVAPDGISLASSRNVNVGITNLVAADHPDVFADLVAGNERITPPQMSDVVLDDEVGVTETMFVGVPIRADGDVIAVFMLRVVPAHDLVTPFFEASPVNGFGRIVFGESGLAITGLGDIGPLDQLEIDGRPAQDFFDRPARGTNLPPGSTSEVERVEAWATAPDLGLGVLTVQDGDSAFDELRALRVGYAVIAILVAVIGLLLGAVALWLLARVRARQLSASTARFRSLVDPSPDAVMRVCPDGSLVAANVALYRLLDPDPDSDDADSSDIARRLRDGDLVTIDELGARHPILREVAVRWPIVAGMFQPTQVERLNAVDGDLRDRYFRVRFVPVGTKEGDKEILVVITDITPDVERELHLESMALVDSLTGLCNRAAITDRLTHALDLLRRPVVGDGVAVIVVDLDRFKPINDAFGHSAGDRVLIAVAEVLAAELRDHDSLGRVGGDEFMLVCEQVPDPEVATELASRVAESLESVSVEIDGSDIFVAGSVGVAWTREPVVPAELIARADRAMLLAKHERDGGRSSASSPQSDEPSILDSVARDLPGALDRREFEMHFQPIVRADGRIVAAEGLLRWNHPEHGLLGPHAFLPSLMQSGHIGSVGRWAVRESLAQAARWRDAGQQIQVHVNVSPVELSTGVIDVFATELDRHGLDPRWVCVEMTEDAFDEGATTSGLIGQLGDLGVCVGLDDFGAGSSTLTRLRQRPLHCLKLDRSFVANIDTAESDADRDVSIVRAIVGLAADLGVDVVAEGVETVRQLEWLRDAGCEKFQGWAFGAAVPAARFRPDRRLVASDVAVGS